MDMDRKIFVLGRNFGLTLLTAFSEIFGHLIPELSDTSCEQKIIGAGQHNNGINLSIIIEKSSAEYSTLNGILCIFLTQ